jgi:hypothetical protein
MIKQGRGADPNEPEAGVWFLHADHGGRKDAIEKFNRLSAAARKAAQERFPRALAEQGEISARLRRQAVERRAEALAARTRVVPEHPVDLFDGEPAEIGDVPPRDPDLSTDEIPYLNPSDVQVGAKIDSGAQAVVHHATVRGTEGFVIKLFPVDPENFGGVEALGGVRPEEVLRSEIAREVLVTRGEPHPNVVQCTGVVRDLVGTAVGSAVGIIYPLVRGGTLTGVVMKGRRGPGPRPVVATS